MTSRQAKSSAPHASAAVIPVLLVVLYAFQVRFPPLSYPAMGQLTLVFLGGFLLLGVARLMRWDAGEAVADAPAEPAVFARHPALLPGMLFLSWNLLRWIFDGAPVDGAATVGTVFWAGAYFLVALMLCSGGRGGGAAHGAGSTFPLYFLRMLCLAALVCGVYAIAQYFWLYHNAYDVLMESIGARAPDRTEAALLHHLQLRRVASFWGDPNSYAVFAAIGVAASLELALFKTRGHAIWRGLGAVSVLVSLAGIYFTGSRGGVLDLLLVLGIYGLFWLLAGKGGLGRGVVSGVLVGAALLLLPAVPRAQTDIAEAETNATRPGWTWRSDTIRERIYYIDVGSQMIRMRPIVGLGPGSVNDWFGRLKDPNAREARNLHNWPVNTWAELGAVGLMLLLWFLGAIVVRAWKGRVWRLPVQRGFVVVFGVLIFDGLMQTSWAQRELMCLFGAACGILVSVSATPEKAAGRGKRLVRLSAVVTVAVALVALDLPYLSAQLYKQMATDAMLANQPQEAQKYWDKASMWSPRDPEPLRGRAHLAMAAGQYSAARQLLRRALELEPESAALNAAAARLAVQMNDEDLAEKHFLQALALYPSHPEYNLEYARFLEGEGRQADAVKYAERARQWSYEPAEQAEIDSFLTQLQKKDTAVPGP